MIQQIQLDNFRKWLLKKYGVEGDTVKGTMTEKIAVEYAEHILNLREKVIFYQGDYLEVYTKEFTIDGPFVVDKLTLTPNHPEIDPSLVTVVKAHSKNNPLSTIEATSDKFTFLNF